MTMFEEETPWVVTAFTRFAGRVTSHCDIEGAITEPVPVLDITSSGAILDGALTEGPVVIYDLEEHDVEEIVEFDWSGHHEIEEGVWVKTYEKIIHKKTTPRVETYAVGVAVD